MELTTIGFDIAKQVFQAHWVDKETGDVCRKRLTRAKVAEFFANREPSLLAMEACGSAHYWARRFRAMGHKVKLIPPKFVRPFVKTNKTDQADAEAIWEAVQRPGMRFVAVKTEEQQAVLALHRLREQLVKVRTMQMNQLRGLLYEFGAVLPPGRQRGIRGVVAALENLKEVVPGLVLEALGNQVDRMGKLTEEITALERRLSEWKRKEDECRRVAEIPGVGLLTATAAVATIGQARAFKSGREFAAFLGLVPRQRGTGGRVRMLGISKRGDVYLRTLLIHGARAALPHLKEKEPWLQRLLARRPFNVVLVALANKMARTIWALLAHGRTYQFGYTGMVSA